ncbi:MAG: LamB/YcsF family protein [Pseudonocardiales bacterium]|nr:MAG: LamB/YcsF family protein [Pseudonocardiales bacterium]
MQGGTRVSAAARSVDLNCDVGEGFGRWSGGDDAALLKLVTSANVACGFHAGDPSIMRSTCALAAERGVVIGAQVGYRDLAGFGRRFIDMAPGELRDDIVYQIGALDGFARIAGTSVRYVKPHGALYNAIVDNTEQASAVVEAITRYDRGLAALGLPGSEFLRLAAAAGLRTVEEAFADRAYTGDGHLVSRHRAHAVIDDPVEVARRCVRMLTGGIVEAIDGSLVTMRPDSICVHGDTVGAVEIARGVRVALTAAGVTLRPFA